MMSLVARESQKSGVSSTKQQEVEIGKWPALICIWQTYSIEQKPDFDHNRRTVYSSNTFVINEILQTIMTWANFLYLIHNTVYMTADFCHARDTLVKAWRRMMKLQTLPWCSFCLQEDWPWHFSSIRQRRTARRWQQCWHLWVCWQGLKLRLMQTKRPMLLLLDYPGAEMHQSKPQAPLLAGQPCLSLTKTANEIAIYWKRRREGLKSALYYRQLRSLSSSSKFTETGHVLTLPLDARHEGRRQENCCLCWECFGSPKIKKAPAIFSSFAISSSAKSVCTIILQDAEKLVQ